MNRRGISAVVATILLVLLTVIAVVIVWAVLKPALIKTAGGITTNCLDVDLALGNVVCSTGSVTVTLNSGQISQVSIVISNATASANLTADAPALLATNTYTINNAPSGATVVRVAGIISANGQIKTCSDNAVSKNC